MADLARERENDPVGADSDPVNANGNGKQGSESGRRGAAAQDAGGERAGGRRQQLVVFSLGDEMYGVDIYRVREIIRVPAITRVPRAPEYVEGVINLRGGVIPVIDLRKRFGMEKGEESAERRIVVSELGNQTVGMVVDGVSEVLEVDEAEIDPPSEYVMTVDSQYITGIVKREKLIILLDLEKVLEVSRRDDKAVAEVGE